MPELPEVEAARRAIEEHCLGKKIIKSIIADDPKVIDGGVSPKDFEAALIGKTIVAAHRKGKNMWLQLDCPPFPSFQFGMTGAVYIKGVAVTKYKRAAVKDADEWPSKYSKFFVELNDGLEFSFTDKRRFARVRLLDNPVAVPPISELGPDALLEPRTVDEFYKLLSKKNIGIKALLLDQGFISGIGNWIADEVLYQARIHPLQSASSMSIEVCGTLINCINEVISKAIEVGADSSQFPSNWIFHSREKKPGKAFVDGRKIEFINAGGRTTAYVPELQKLTGAQATKEAGKPQKSSAKRTKNSKKGGGSDDDDEQESEEEVKIRNFKVKGGKKTTSGTNASMKRKLKESPTVAHDDDDDDGDDDYEDDDPKKTSSRKLNASSKPKGSYKEDNESELKLTTGKNTSRKRKPVESDDSSGGDDKNYNGNKKNRKETKMQKASKEKFETGQNRRSTRKKVN